MADRLTQIQQCVDKLSEIFYISVGALQRDAPLVEPNGEIPVTAWTQEQINSNWKGCCELAQQSAQDIKELSQVIEFLIDKLPGINVSEEDQLKKLEQLRILDEQLDSELRQEITRGEKLLQDLNYTKLQIIQNSSKQ